MINYLNIVHREKSGHPPQADRFFDKDDKSAASKHSSDYAYKYVLWC